MPRVLLISYFYPPLPDVGVARAARMARYLSDYDWTPHVLTVKPPADVPGDQDAEAFAPVTRTACKRLMRGQDPAIGETSGPSVSGAGGADSRGVRRLIQRAIGWPGWSGMRLPDKTMGWAPHAVRAGRRLFEQQSFDAIWSTFAPISSHVTAWRLSRLFNTPWVADFRDPWSFNHLQPRSGCWQKLDETVERRLIRSSAAVTTVSEPWAERMSRFHNRPVTVIHNGYDDDWYDRTIEPPDRGVFRMVYTGSLHADKENPIVLFNALCTLKREGVVAADRFQLSMWGPSSEVVMPMAREAGVDDLVHIQPRRPRKEMPAIQQSAQALLFVEWADEPTGQGLYTCKLYEYLGARRPILALASPERIAGRLINECGAGRATMKEEHVEDVLREWIRSFEKDGRAPYEGRPERLRACSARTSAGHLAQLLDRVSTVP